MGSKPLNRLTEEEQDFLREAIPGHTYGEVADLFTGRFGRELSKYQVRRARIGLGIPPNERKGFEKGNTLGNKFQPGKPPANARRWKIGDERTDYYGYVVVKVSDRSTDGRKGSCWRLKAHIKWEEYHGKPLPDGYVVMYANRDRSDLSPENLVAVPREVMDMMTYCHMQYYDRTSLEVCTTMARIRLATKNKREAICRA